MRIGILGGSFDPIHNGHLALARESQRQFDLQKILFVPTLIPPHKVKDSALSPAPVRARIVELAIQGQKDWELCDIELKRQGISYTVDTLRELHKEYPQGKFFFIAGADSFHDLKQWKEPDQIMKLSEWIVAPRPSYGLPAQMPPGFHKLQIAPMSISATELRQKIEQGREVSEWIPEKVLEYLKRMNIYQRVNP